MPEAFTCEGLHTGLDLGGPMERIGEGGGVATEAWPTPLFKGTVPGDF
jgi:hypothetical protein